MSLLSNVFSFVSYSSPQEKTFPTSHHPDPKVHAPEYISGCISLSVCILHFVLSFFQVACIFVFKLFTDVFFFKDSLIEYLLHYYLLFSTCDFAEKGLCRLSHFWGWTFREEPRASKALGDAEEEALQQQKPPRLVDQEKQRRCSVFSALEATTLV